MDRGLVQLSSCALAKSAHLVHCCFIAVFGILPDCLTSHIHVRRWSCHVGHCRLLPTRRLGVNMQLRWVWAFRAGGCVAYLEKCLGFALGESGLVRPDSDTSSNAGPRPAARTDRASNGLKCEKRGISSLHAAASCCCLWQHCIHGSSSRRQLRRHCHGLGMVSFVEIMARSLASVSKETNAFGASPPCARPTIPLAACGRSRRLRRPTSLL